MKETIRRISNWMAGKKDRPVKLQINPTNRCNLKCRFCWLRDFDNGDANYDELSPERYLELIDEARNLGIEKIEITGGGEPFCRKDILDIMKRIKSNSIYGDLITNGTMLDEGTINEIVGMRWNRIVFSLDAPDKVTNDYLRGIEGAFERTTETIKKFVEAKKALRFHTPELCVHMVLCSKNYDKLSDMFDFVNSLGVNNLFIEPIVLLAEKTKAGKDLLIGDSIRKELLLEIEKAIDTSRKYHFRTNIDSIRLDLIENVNMMEDMIIRESSKYENSIPCYQPWYQMIIRPWGVVGPCCMFDNEGDNVKEKSLEDIWFGENFTKIRKRLSEGKLLEFCSKCNPSQLQENNKIRRMLESG